MKSSFRVLKQILALKRYMQSGKNEQILKIILKAYFYIFIYYFQSDFNHFSKRFFFLF